MIVDFVEHLVLQPDLFAKVLILIPNLVDNSRDVIKLLILALDHILLLLNKHPIVEALSMCELSILVPLILLLLKVDLARSPALKRILIDGARGSSSGLSTDADLYLLLQLLGILQKVVHGHNPFVLLSLRDIGVLGIIVLVQVNELVESHNF